MIAPIHHQGQVLSRDGGVSPFRPHPAQGPIQPLPASLRRVFLRYIQPLELCSFQAAVFDAFAFGNVLFNRGCTR